MENRSTELIQQWACNQDHLVKRIPRWPVRVTFSNWLIGYRVRIVKSRASLPCRIIFLFQSGSHVGSVLWKRDSIGWENRSNWACICVWLLSFPLASEETTCLALLSDLPYHYPRDLVLLISLFSVTRLWRLAFFQSFRKRKIRLYWQASLIVTKDKNVRPCCIRIQGRNVNRKHKVALSLRRKKEWEGWIPGSRGWN